MPGRAKPVRAGDPTQDGTLYPRRQPRCALVPEALRLRSRSRTGEIAVRLLNAVRDLGLRAVAIYALDEDTAHCVDVDASYKLSGGAQAFLDIHQVVQIAKERVLSASPRVQRPR